MEKPLIAIFSPVQLLPVLFDTSSVLSAVLDKLHSPDETAAALVRVCSLSTAPYGRHGLLEQAASCMTYKVVDDGKRVVTPARILVDV